MDATLDQALIHPWHVLLTLLLFIGALAEALRRIANAGTEFRKNVLDELRVSKVSIKELLADLAERKPEAMARIVVAMDDQKIIDFVRDHGAVKK